MWKVTGKHYPENGEESVKNMAKFTFFWDSDFFFAPKIFGLKSQVH